MADREILVVVEPGLIAGVAFGAFEPAEEIGEVRMRAARDAAPALRLTLDQPDLHSLQARRRLRWKSRAEPAAISTGPADGPNTTNALKPSHNATPVQTRVVVMMCSRPTKAGITNGDLRESGKPG